MWNEAGQRLIEFCQENALVIANTLFQQHKRRFYTWTSPDGQHWNQIDYIICKQRWRSSTQSGADSDHVSDHELFIAKFRLKLKKAGKTTRPFKYYLNHIPYDYTVKVDILGISELKWTGMGEFDSDDHYIYYCRQESLRRNGVAIMVNKRVWNAVLGCNLKNDRMSSVRFQGKPFNITVIQVYAPTSNAEEAEVEWFYEDLQDLLELTPKKDVLFIIGD